MKLKNGFTLIELLVVIGILSISFGLFLTIFTRVLQGGNKTQVIGSIKQNGQSILEVMDKTIRGSDRVVCVANSGTTSVVNAPNSGDTLVVVQEGVYTRFRFFAPSTPAACSSNNGCIKQESFKSPSSPAPSADPNLYLRDFESSLCVDPMPLNVQAISDTNAQTGVSITCLPPSGIPECSTTPVFTRVRSSGFKDQVVIKFGVKPGVSAPASATGQVDDINFQTTISLR